MSSKEFKRKHEYNLQSNKDMVIDDIIGIRVDNFRLFKNQIFELGSHITIVSGRNGTMKSTLMGLIAQPYNSEHRDVFGRKMETKFSEVFKLSSEKDKNDYLYHIRLKVNGNLLLEEPVPLYFQPGNKNTKYSQKDRHRLVPSGRQKGDGYFSLPSVYINLKRLYPLIDSGEIIQVDNIEYTDEEIKFIGIFYQKVLLKSDFDEFNKYSAKTINSKKPYGPGEKSYYDVHSISSGEDNLSTFVDVMISFMRVFKIKQDNNLTGLTGIFSIDEFEASLHPIAQANLFDFLYKWGKRYKVKVLLNTHSLFLIQYVYLTYEKDKEQNDIILNFIESDGEDRLTIIKNPEYKTAYRELTLSNMEEKSNLLKVKVLCEDKVAENAIKRMIKNRKITTNIAFSHKVSNANTGTSNRLLTQLCKNFPAILEETKSIVIVDADTNIEEYKQYYKYLTKIPSIYGYAFEKEIVRYVLELDTAHKLFNDLGETKEMMKQRFVQYNINLNKSNYDTITNTTPFKNWYSSTENTILSKIITHYIKDHKEMVDQFRNELLTYMNQIRVKHGFTRIEL